MVNSKKDLIVILVVGLILMYGLPLLSRLLPTNIGFLVQMGSLVAVNPTFGFIAGVVYTARNSFHITVPLLTGAIFITAIFLFYNTTAIVYILIYIVTSFIGCGISYVMYYKA